MDDICILSKRRLRKRTAARACSLGYACEPSQIIASLAMSSIFAASFRAETAAPSLFIPFTIPFIKCIACRNKMPGRSGHAKRI